MLLSTYTIFLRLRELDPWWAYTCYEFENDNSNV